MSENCKDIRKDQILISFAAAFPIWLIDSVLCKEIAIVRVIPNTPSQIGKGVNPYCLGKYINQEQLKDVEELLNVFGNAIKIEEKQMNLATALTAVGPTYWLPPIQSLIDFAIKNGMNRELAFKLVNETIIGTAELVKYTNKNPDELKLMIGTRTINEVEIKTIFTEALESAFNKIVTSENKLTQ